MKGMKGGIMNARYEGGGGIMYASYEAGMVQCIQGMKREWYSVCKV